MDKKNQQGYIALTSVVLISASLLILTAVLSASGYYLRFNVLEYEFKKTSVALAEACAQTAMVKIAKDPGLYPGSIPAAGEQQTLGSGKSCRICSVSGSNPYTITTRAEYRQAYTNMTVQGTLGASNYTISDWNEQANYTGSCTLP